MEALEQDLQSSQKQINQWLALYNKASEDIISLNLNTQIHNILDAIACFDHQKIKTLETETKDEIVIGHLNQIALKIKNASEQKPPAPAPEHTKRQSRIAEKTQPKNAVKKQNKEGFISSVFNRFKSKDKKPTEMIFPTEEPKCYWDQKTRSYIFQGEEPQAPKEIPKPPPKNAKSKIEEPKKGGQQTQLDSLTAPPTFKRKGAPKNKSKIKEEIQVASVPSEEPMSFANLMTKINDSYTLLLERVRKGSYERHIPQVHLHNENELSQFVSASERLLNASQQIYQQEHKFLCKWGKTSLAEPNLKIMQKLTKQVGESVDIYQILNRKLDDLTKDAGILRKSQEYLKSPLSSQRQLIQVKNIEEEKRLSQELEEAKSEVNSLKGNLLAKDHEFTMIQTRLKEKNQESKKLFQQSIDLKNQVVQLKNNLDEKLVELRKINIRFENNYSKQQENERVILNLRSQNKELDSKIEILKEEVKKLKNEKMQLDVLLKISQANKSNESSKLSEEAEKQKLKIQAQLNFYEEREKNYLINIKNMQDHTSFIYQFEETVQQQNNLLNNILEKRLQLRKNNDTDEGGASLAKLQEETTSPHSVILELSDIINSITQTHLDRLEIFNKNYAHLNKKYYEAKELVKKIKSNSSNQNISLNRSVTRLKSLIQTYKTSKEESEEKCKLLELQCEKLKKKLEHYKQEDKFNKSYLSKLKSSSRGVVNQNDSVISLQQDNEELAQTIQDLQNEVGLKEENNTKLQKDLQDLLNHYEKNQARLVNIEKKSRENDKEVRLLREEKEELLNRINLLEVKLTNQRERNQELIKHQASKLKTIQNTHEKKIKVLKEDLKRAQKNEEEIRAELQEERNSYTKKYTELAESIKEKQTENNQLLTLIEATNDKAQQQAVTIAQLQQRNDDLETKQFDIANSIHDYNSAEIQAIKQSQKRHNQMIKSILTQYKDFEKDEREMREEYQKKINYLSKECESANNKSQQLLQNIENYATLVKNLDRKLEQMQNQADFAKTQQQRVIQKQQIQANQLTQLVNCMQQEIETKKQQISELQTLTQKISIQNESLKEQIDTLTVKNGELSNQNEDLSKKIEVLQRNKEDLEDKLSCTEKQMEMKESEITNKSESLLIKNEELQEKNEMILNTEQNLVLSKEELEDLKNALQEKDNKITELTSDLQMLAKQLENVNSQETEIKQTQDLQENKTQQFKELKEELLAKDIQMLSLRKQAQALGKKLGEVTQSLKEKERQSERLAKQMSLNNGINQELEKEITMLKETISKSKTVKDQEEEQKDQEMESEMEYLLKEIQNRENQITQLEKKVKILQQDNQILKEENSKKKPEQNAKEEKNEQQVEGEMEFLLKEIKEREEEVSQLKDKNQLLCEELQKQRGLKEQLLIANKQLQKENETLDLNILSMQSTKKTLQISVDLLQKDKDQFQKRINGLLEELQKEKKNSQESHPSEDNKELVFKLQSDLKEKSRVLTKTLIEKQETERLLFIAQSELKQAESKIPSYETQIKQLCEVIQSQEETLGKYNELSEKDDNSLTEELKRKNNELVEANNKIQELRGALSSKSKDYEEKIQNLERQIVAINSLKSSNKKLEDNVKALELQNSNLLIEKVELLRSNQNLMKINEKLITEVSPHNKLNDRHIPKQEKSGTKERKEEKADGQKKEEVTKSTISEPSKPTKQDKQESKSFFGTISSLFLTQTQNDRLGKK